METENDTASSKQNAPTAKPASLHRGYPAEPS